MASYSANAILSGALIVMISCFCRGDATSKTACIILTTVVSLLVLLCVGVFVKHIIELFQFPRQILKDAHGLSQLQVLKSSCE